MSDSDEERFPGDEVAPTLRTLAAPKDVNVNGDIFGGWVLAQMDVAGGVVAMRRAAGPVATVGIEAMKFHRPVLIGDEVSLYANVMRVGRTSIRVKIDTWARRSYGTETVKVTEGIFTYVAIGPDRRPRPVDPEIIDV
jgi:acyl-CoA thioesterase YciA